MNALPPMISIDEMKNNGIAWSGPPNDIELWQDYVYHKLGSPDIMQPDGNHLYDIKKFNEWEHNEHTTLCLNTNLFSKYIKSHQDEDGHYWQIEMKIFCYIATQVTILAKAICTKCKISHYIISDNPYKIEGDDRFDLPVHTFIGIAKYDYIYKYILNYSECERLIEQCKLLIRMNNDYDVTPTCDEQIMRDVIE